jgi:hypothetical protein
MQEVLLTTASDRLYYVVRQAIPVILFVLRVWNLQLEA